MTSHVVYPGSFDPVTNGHIDLVERSSRVFGQVIVGVASGHGKEPLFPVEERVALMRQATASMRNVRVESFDGLLVDYLRQKESCVVIRGLRAISDFEYELQMALTNRQLSGEIETIFLMPSQEYVFLSSRIVKAVAGLGGDVSAWVPPVVFEALRRKYSRAPKEVPGVS